MTLVILLTSVRPYQGLSKAKRVKCVNDFEPPWWSCEKFYASVVLQKLFVPPPPALPTPFFFLSFLSTHSVLAYAPSLLRFDESENEEDATENPT